MVTTWRSPRHARCSRRGTRSSAHCNMARLQLVAVAVAVVVVVAAGGGGGVGVFGEHWRWHLGFESGIIWQLCLAICLFGAWLRLYLNSPLSIDGHASWRKTSMANIKLQICANRRQTGVLNGLAAATARKLLSMLDIAGLNFFWCACQNSEPKVAAALVGHQETLTQRAALKLRGRQVFKLSKFAMHKCGCCMLPEIHGQTTQQIPTYSNIKILRKLSSIGKHGSVQWVELEPSSPFRSDLMDGDGCIAELPDEAALWQAVKDAYAQASTYQHIIYL